MLQRIRRATNADGFFRALSIWASISAPSLTGFSPRRPRLFELRKWWRTSASTTHSLKGSFPLVRRDKLAAQLGVMEAGQEIKEHVALENDALLRDQAPGVSQLYDIAGRLLEYRLPRLELAHASDRQLPTELVGRINDEASAGYTRLFVC